MSDYKPTLPSSFPLLGERARVRADVLNLEKAGMRAEFTNDAPESAEITEFENILNVQEDGWAHLAPYGDFPGKGFRKVNGAVEQFPAIQRMDRAAAEDMARKFNGPASRIKRFFSGCPIYNGHPNTMVAGDRYPDKAPKGTIVELAARDNGLYCKPVFFKEAEPILAQSTKIFFSGHWSSDELPAENGKRIFRPDKLKSAGLTPFPNLPVEHVNDREKTTNDPNETMNKKVIIDFLAAHGVQFANEATDDQLAAALKTLGEKANTAETLTAEKTQWANEKTTLTGTVTALTTERDQARTNFANERIARITGLLDTALQDGRITAAERPQWEGRLAQETQFANEAEALVKLPKKMKTEAVTLQMGERKVEIANSVDRREALHKLVNAEMSANGGDYDRAYATVQKTHPALFAAMKAPAIQNPKY